MHSYTNRPAQGTVNSTSSSSSTNPLSLLAQRVVRTPGKTRCAPVTFPQQNPLQLLKQPPASFGNNIVAQKNPLKKLWNLLCCCCRIPEEDAPQGQSAPPPDTRQSNASPLTTPFSVPGGYNPEDEYKGAPRTGTTVTPIIKPTSASGGPGMAPEKRKVPIAFDKNDPVLKPIIDRYRKNQLAYPGLKKMMTMQEAEIHEAVTPDKRERSELDGSLQPEEQTLLMKAWIEARHHEIEAGQFETAYTTLITGDALFGQTETIEINKGIYTVSPGKDMDAPLDLNEVDLDEPEPDRYILTNASINNLIIGNKAFPLIDAVVLHKPKYAADKLAWDLMNRPLVTKWLYACLEEYMHLYQAKTNSFLSPLTGQYKALADKDLPESYIEYDEVDIVAKLTEWGVIPPLLSSKPDKAEQNIRRNFEMNYEGRENFFKHQLEHQEDGSLSLTGRKI